MAWLLLGWRMCPGKPKNPPFRCTAFLCATLTLGLLPSGASCQTGSITARQTGHQLVMPQATIRADTVIQLRNQPHLEKHIDRINRFRTLLRESRVKEPAPEADKDGATHTAGSSAPVIPTRMTADQTDAKDLAILELEMSISARQGPSTFYPGAGLMLALQQISNLSNRHMIDALRQGGKPIYSNRGHLIGVEDPATGRLLGGRRS